MKKIQILLLLIIYMSNLISTQIQDKKESIAALSIKPTDNIINQIIKDTFLQEFLAELDNWRDIFEEGPKSNLSLKIDNSHKKNGIKKLSIISLSFIIESDLASTQIDNNLLELFNNLKKRRFNQLFFSLKNNALKEYENISKQNLDSKLIEILNSRNAKEKFQDVVKLILANADVNIKDKNGNTALMWAVEYNYKEIVEILINAGADVNSKNNNNNTALMYASFKGQKSIVEMLLNAGADVNLKGKDDNTALIFAAAKGHKEIVKILLKSNADINAKDEFGKTALIWATIKGYKNIIKLLVKKEADIDAQANLGWTALFFAVERGEEDIVDIFLKSNVNVNVRDVNEWTPLTLAFEKNHKDIIDKLISAGADVNVKANVARTSFLVGPLYFLQLEKFLKIE